MPDVQQTPMIEPLSRPVFTRERPIRVHSTKYDGSLHYEFEAFLLDSIGPLLRCWVPAGTPVVSYHGSGAVKTGFTALFFTDRWFNVYHQHRPHGRRALEVYVNIGSPATFDGRRLTWVDLDVDVLLERDGIVIDDEDEFAAHRVRMRYPEDLVERVMETTGEVTRALTHRSFPFDRSAHVPAAGVALPGN